MREIRLHGSEGGGAEPIGSPYPYHSAPPRTCGSDRLWDGLPIRPTFVTCRRVRAEGHA